MRAGSRVRALVRALKSRARESVSGAEWGGSPPVSPVVQGGARMGTRARSIVQGVLWGLLFLAPPRGYTVTKGG
jgi:hypothetical protein